jgi:hypothetical protein
MVDIDSKSKGSISGPGSAGHPPSPTALVIAGVGVLVVAALLAVIVLLSHDAQTQVTSDTTMTTGDATITTGRVTVPASPATSDAPQTAVWPWETSSTRFADPVDAARSFATEFLGFTAPVVGPFAQGDSRSGEVEVRPRSKGPVSTVFVRQGGDDSWWVIGAANEHITLDEPEVMDEIRSPVRLRGTALAFEGTVQVHVREDGRREPIGVGIVTGGGDEPGPFEDAIDFSTPRASAGAVVLFTESAEDGRVWQAGVIRVRFSSTRR